uniref:5'-(N(7)-methylguanosine 5'-triphospho)-[mRNA] hydrolase n=2 Tax=Castor canadensis TaxID=51338 RepID=A0A8B7WJM1_CASCN|nr:mRNA-decapping enzyme 1B [Castor canadensis]
MAAVFNEVLKMLSIYGIWFYDKEECQRIAELMKNLTQSEQLKAHQEAGAGISPMILNSREGKEVDILRMLTKAKDEYTKCKTCSEPKQITSSAICDNPNVIKPIPVKPSDSQQHRGLQPSQTLDHESRHLSLTALFGKHDKMPCQGTMEPPLIPQQQRQQQEKLPVRQGVVRSLSYEEPRMPSPPVEKQLCPAIQKLMVRSTDLHPLSELPEQRPCEADGTHPMGAVLSGPIQPGSPQNIRTSHGTQSASRTQNLLEKLQSSPGAVNKYNATAPTPASPAALSAAIPTAPQLGYFNGPFPPPRGHQAPGKEQCPLGSPALPLPGGQASNPGALPPQELLRKLQAVQQEQQLQVAHRPALAAKFPVVAQSSRTGKPLEAWISKASSMEKQAPLLQVISPQCIPATVAPSLLMSPMVFTQSSCAAQREKESGLLPLGGQEPRAASPGLLLPLKNPEPSAITCSPLTRLQLQEALLYLVQNDDNFLNIIYEAYLFSMTQAAMRKTI